MSGTDRLRRLRFVLTWRWAGYLAGVIVFAIACVLLSQWQFARREEAVEKNRRVVEHYDSAAVPIESVLPELSRFNPADEWTVVELRGHYLVDDALLARTRPFNGQPGFEQLVPFETHEGRVLVVDRGWIPTGARQDDPDHVPTPPSGELTVEARLRPGEPTLPGRDANGRQVPSINLPTIARVIDREGDVYEGAYGYLKSETPPAAEVPIAFPKPALSEGNHLSYAFQWLVFAVLGFVFLALAIRNEYRILNEHDPRQIARRERERAKRAQKRRTDAEIEDELLGN